MSLRSPLGRVLGTGSAKEVRARQTFFAGASEITKVLPF